MRRNSSDTGTESLRIHLLGGFKVIVGIRLVGDSEWRLRKAKNLVKLLAIAPENRLHRDQAIEALWQDMEPEAATNNLHKALYVARRALDPAPASAGCYLQVQGDWLVLPSPHWIDVSAFGEASAQAKKTRSLKDIQKALDLYTGDLLPEDRYEDWASNQREQLKQEYVSLLTTRSSLHESSGQLPQAVEAFRRIVATDPNQGFHFHTGSRLAQMLGYKGEWLEDVPASATESFAGTDNPFSLGLLESGSHIVDVGSGAGLDSLIVAKMVGTEGKVIGVDMTPAMLEKAQHAAKEVGLNNVEFRGGYAEALPVPDGWADVVISKAF